MNWTSKVAFKEKMRCFCVERNVLRSLLEQKETIYRWFRMPFPKLGSQCEPDLWIFVVLYWQKCIVLVILCTKTDLILTKNLDYLLRETKTVFCHTFVWAVVTRSMYCQRQLHYNAINVINHLRFIDPT